MTTENAEPKKTAGENEGEGNKSADKAYREAASEFAKTHDTEGEARAAEKEIEQDPAAYAAAEKAGKAHSAGDDKPAKAKV